MQGLEQNTIAVVPGGAQPLEKSVMKSQIWKENREKFLKGEPKVLGALQVMIALINLSLGIIIMINIPVDGPVFSVTLLVPIWGPIMFLISGSLSIAAGVETTKGLVISSLTLNTINSVLTMAASIIAVISVVVGIFSPRFNNNPVINALDILMLILNLLEFCIAVSVSAFGCKASCCNSREVLVVLPSHPAVTVTAPPTTFQPLLPSEHQGKHVPENLYKSHPGERVYF
ncbi:membrane-spanning 4-domains subfamily A member 4D-like isoform X1 [Apodemus sylvaticus]|uniref:membrane-spanning 4-domains subfamily A member 4D-like isoform X1 n=1 Tax=Apodemus sylvaticus TaxID=10129 RepID=UPI0022427EA6|nr:membrane-spanning 4-domains subfamily A member 4D-like isoform X1 [Apodemus sylvaticus]